MWDSPWGRIGFCICYDLSYRRVTDRLAALGAVVTGISIAIAFYIAPQPWIVWTVLFFVGVGLIVWDTRQDTARPGAWPLTK